MKVEIAGRNFPELSTVTVNGKTVKSTYDCHEKVTATIPAELNKAGARLEVKVQVIDSKDTVIAETPACKLER
ncbi:hypothetical protein D3C87_2024340 [compost metagenome]